MFRGPLGANSVAAKAHCPKSVPASSQSDEIGLDEKRAHDWDGHMKGLLR